MVKKKLNNRIIELIERENIANIDGEVMLLEDDWTRVKAKIRRMR